MKGITMEHKTDTFTSEKIKAMLPFIKDGAEQIEKGIEPKIKSLLVSAQAEIGKDLILGNTALSNIIKIYCEIPEAIEAWAKSEWYISKDELFIHVRDVTKLYETLQSKGCDVKSSLTTLKKEAEAIGITLLEYIEKLDKSTVNTTKVHMTV